MIDDQTGVVMEFRQDGFYRIFCRHAPEHLRTMWLQGWAIRSAKVGDRVRLSYRETGRGYEWVVTEVLL